MTIKLTAEVSALLPPNWQTRLFANDPFTFEWEGIGTPVNVAKGQTESATGSIAVPAKKYIDLKKIDNNIWILSGTYAERMIYTGTSETPPAGWSRADRYLRYSVGEVSGDGPAGAKQRQSFQAAARGSRRSQRQTFLSRTGLY